MSLDGKLTGREPRELKLWDGKDKMWGMADVRHQACPRPISYSSVLESDMLMAADVAGRPHGHCGRAFVDNGLSCNCICRVCSVRVSDPV